MTYISLWSFITALLVVATSIPVIIKVADLKHLMDEPDNFRKIHTYRTPTLGGIAMFAGTLFSFSVFTDYLNLSEIKFMVPSLILLFFAGIKDDILVLSPGKKLAVQIFCGSLITILGNLRITNLWGMFGIGEISPISGAVLTLLIIVSLINAFNLIDGVNGLAGSLGLVACLFFGSWFSLMDTRSWSILAFSLSGALCGFLYFNFPRAKIFMGDTGSMILGFIVSILAIKFVEHNRSSGIELSPYYIKAAPAVAIAVVFIPLMDMSRVFFTRIASKKSPFSPDRIHIHHILLDIGFSHVQVSIILLISALLIITLSLLLRELRSIDVLLILTSATSIPAIWTIWLRKKSLSPSAHR